MSIMKISKTFLKLHLIKIHFFLPENILELQKQNVPEDELTEEYKKFYFKKHTSAELDIIRILWDRLPLKKRRSNTHQYIFHKLVILLVVHVQYII